MTEKDIELMKMQNWFRVIGYLPDREPDCHVQLWVEGGKVLYHATFGEYSYGKESVLAATFKQIANDCNNERIIQHDHRTMWS